MVLWLMMPSGYLGRSSKLQFYGECFLLVLIGFYSLWSLHFIHLTFLIARHSNIIHTIHRDFYVMEYIWLVLSSAGVVYCCYCHIRRDKDKTHLVRNYSSLFYL